MITLEPILDLNNSVLAHRSGYPKVCDPISIVDGIKSNGEICTNFEFILFGVWLMIDSQPGLASSTGPAASINNVLRTVAAAAAMVWYAEAPVLLAKKSCKKPVNTGPGWITATKLRDRWHIMYDEAMDQAVFKSRLKSAQRYIRAYLAHLDHPPTDAATIKPNIRTVRSRHLEKVLAAMTPAAKP